MPPPADPECPPPPSPVPPPPPPRCCRCRDRAAPCSRGGGGRSRRRCRRLLPVLAALGAVALGAAAAAAALLGVLRGERPAHGPPPQGATAAHLLLSTGSLAVSSRPLWRYEEGISGVFLSSDLEVTAAGLRVAAGGLYLLYGQFALACTAENCPPGNVTLQLRRAGSVSPLLSVPLALPGATDPGPARSGLAQAVELLQSGDVLDVELVGDIGGDEWQMAQDQREGNFVGMLRIAGG